VNRVERAVGKAVQTTRPPVSAASTWKARFRGPWSGRPPQRIGRGPINSALNILVRRGANGNHLHGMIGGGWKMAITQWQAM
jgi:hypothetical protein